MKNIADLKSMKPLGAEGRVCIDYTDPVTGKIKEQVKGTNHVFTDSLFGVTGGINYLITLPLFLSDNAAPVDVNFPYMTGNILGYGHPNTGSSGLYRGAWNSASGYLGVMTSTGISSKFVYDFSPSQAAGEVKQVGITTQFVNLDYYASQKYFVLTGAVRSASDQNSLLFGANLYNVSTSGVVTKTNLLSGISTTYDLSATVGSSYNAIGVNPSDGTWYIKAGNSAANKKLYKYLDDTFSTLLATYNITSWTSFSGTNAFGVWGSYIYDVCSKLSLNYVTDSEYSSITINADPAVSDYLGNTSLARFLVSIADKYVFLSGGSNQSGVAGPIFNLEQGATIGFFGALQNGAGGIFKCPFNSSDKAFYDIGAFDRNRVARIKNAVAIYRLPVDAPTRPAGSGMTVTYELDILY